MVDMATNGEHRSFHIRDFPVDLRHRLRELAAKRRTTIRELAIEAIRELVERDEVPRQSV